MSRRISNFFQKQIVKNVKPEKIKRTELLSYLWTRFMVILHFRNSHFYHLMYQRKLWYFANRLEADCKNKNFNKRFSFFFSTPPCIKIAGTTHFNPYKITVNEGILKFLLHFPTLSNPLNIIMLSKIWVYCDLENYPQPNSRVSLSSVTNISQNTPWSKPF